MTTIPAHAAAGRPTPEVRKALTQRMAALRSAAEHHDAYGSSGRLHEVGYPDSAEGMRAAWGEGDAIATLLSLWSRMPLTQDEADAIDAAIQADA